MNFGLALISDPTDATRSFTSLQATAANAQFSGVEGLTVQAQQVLLNINRGVRVEAQPEVVTKVNTKLKLEVAAQMQGTLTLTRAADAGSGRAQDVASVAVGFGSGQTEELFAGALVAGFESLRGLVRAM